MVSSVLSPEKIVGRQNKNRAAAQNFISGGSVLGASVVNGAANKIVGFQRAGIKPASSATGSIVSTISTNINNNVTGTVNKTLQGFSADYQKRINQVDDAKPIGILSKFLNVYKTALGFINFFGNKKNIDKVRDNLEALKKSFTESFEVAKLIRQVIIKIVKQLSNLPVASPSGGGGLNLDVDIPGGGLKKSAPKGRLGRMVSGIGGRGKMLALGAGALGLGAAGAGVVNALSDSPQEKAQSVGASPEIPGDVVDGFSSIVDKFANAISKLFENKKQKPKQQSPGGEGGGGDPGEGDPGEGDPGKGAVDEPGGDPSSPGDVVRPGRGGGGSPGELQPGGGGGRRQPGGGRRQPGGGGPGGGGGPFAFLGGSQDPGQPGVDFTLKGTQNRAVLSGTVVEIKRQYNPNVTGGDGRQGAGYGNYLVIRSTNPVDKSQVDTLYAHFPKGGIKVKEGDKVSVGQDLGRMATEADFANPATRKEVGSGTGPHTSVDFFQPGSNKAAPGARNLGDYILKELGKGDKGAIKPQAQPQPASKPAPKPAGSRPPGGGAKPKPVSKPAPKPVKSASAVVKPAAPSIASAVVKPAAPSIASAVVAAPMKSQVQPQNIQYYTAYNQPQSSMTIMPIMMGGGGGGKQKPVFIPVGGGGGGGTMIMPGPTEGQVVNSLMQTMLLTNLSAA